jgi:glycosyltransferase involved in cell wall biosynthesis
MTRFAGIKNDRIQVVSNQIFNNKDLTIIQIPKELDNISSKVLTEEYYIKSGMFVWRLEKKPLSKIKLAFIGNWAMACGIATYNGKLWPEIAKHINNFKLFIEKDNNPIQSIYSFGNSVLNKDIVIPCWKRGESLQELVLQIKKYDPDIILIGHEWGLFHNAAHFLSMLTQLSNYKIITTMHSIFADHKDKLIIEAALGGTIITHLEGAKKNLLAKGINSNIYVIPHGCDPISNQNKLWNIYKTEHTFIQQGFGLRYKNFEWSIKAAAILKQKYSDIFFTGLISETPFAKNEHNIYINELMDLVEKNNLQNNVALIRGFQTNDIVDSYFRTNRVAVFPYMSAPGSEVFGSSGAVRLAITAGVPSITSSMHHFDDVPSIKINSPEELAKEIDILFSNKNLQQEQIKKQNKFAEDNSWVKVAQKYVDIFEK